MNDVVYNVSEALKNIGDTPTGTHPKTGDIRKISAEIFKDIKGQPRDYVFAICNELLGQRNWPMEVIAFDFAYRMKKQYDESTFAVFERWLEEYVRGWGDCDDFCTHAFGELICQNTQLSQRTVLWAQRKEFWMRRAAAVVLIPSIWQNLYTKTNPLQVANILMADEHDLVRKGYGWMLKVLSTKEPQLVFDYLLQHKNGMPRVAYRYALEKLDAEQKAILMQH